MAWVKRSGRAAWPAGGPGATRSRSQPAPAPARHPASPWIPRAPSSPPQWLTLRPSPPQPLNACSSTGGVLTRLASQHRLLVTVGRIPIHHAAAAAVNPASNGLVPVSTRQWQPAGVAALLRAMVVCQCSSMTRDANQPPDWPSEAPLALRMASPGALFAFLGAGQRPAHRLCSSEQHVSRMLSSSLPALACEFELAGLAPGPRLISAILEYAILAGSLLSPYLRARLTNFACGLVDTHNPSSWVVCER